MSKKGLGMKHNKVIHMFASGILLVALSFQMFPCYDNQFNISSENVFSERIVNAKARINIGKKKLEIYEGQTYKFNNKKYTWKTSNKKIVSVNKKGKLKAKKAGSVKITAIKKIGKKTKKAVCKVKVGKYAKDVVISSAKTVILKNGQTSTIKAQVVPVKALYKDLIYKSDNLSVASVDSSGKITPVNAGNATITIQSKAINKKKKVLVKTVTVVVLADTASPSATPDASGKNDLFTDTGDDFVVITPTSAPTTKPTLTPGVTDKPVTTQGPINTESPTGTPETTNSPVPTETPQPTMEPVPTPTTIADYIATLKPDPDKPLVGSFTVANAQGTVRTIYLLNKAYAGNMKLQIDSYTYAAESSVINVLKQLETERISVKNSAGTIHVYRKKLEDSWTVHFLKENKMYYFSGKQQDVTWGSNYGVIIADGNTLDVIKILTD